MSRMSKQEKDRILSTPHLNVHDLKIYSTQERGRGVYASHYIPRGTTIEISPVLFFSEKEYRDYGRYTTLDHYTFIWGDGRMALPLGLGVYPFKPSPNNNHLTNHGSRPGEELFIFYGHKLWFQDASAHAATSEETPSQEGNAWNEMAAIDIVSNTKLLSPRKYNLSLEAIFVIPASSRTLRVAPGTRYPFEWTVPRRDQPASSQRLAILRKIKSIFTTDTDIAQASSSTSLNQQTLSNTVSLRSSARLRTARERHQQETNQANSSTANAADNPSRASKSDKGKRRASFPQTARP
ncbi:14684_t:CDS:2 [Acaulospora colombiana]|uniref:14684_t:CDS:1 n=1 Tax=Acaulospora colombiana TaxID=27376 RepID=A0ACA9N6Y6_9GLOM|nr:14684_t:CDS:2 [Acaulospora colombiana]